MTLRIIIAACIAFLLAGCEPAKPPFNSVDVTGIQGYGSDFRLTDHTGKSRTMLDFRGKVVAIFFGFTFCPDVCPTTLSEMRQVMQQLGPQSENLQVLFITVDPKRDSAEVLSKYVPSFYPTFLGLYGDDAATRQVTKDFKIIARVVIGQTPDSYTVDHSAGMLIFDGQGRLRLMASYGLGAEKLTADIKQLM
ncbi:MAG: SCO family protein [Pseudomonadota bacterium]